jgi:hypothetical protein
VRRVACVLSGLAASIVWSGVAIAQQDMVRTHISLLLKGEGL